MENRLLLANKTSIGIGIANNSTVSNTCKLIKMIGGSNIATMCHIARIFGEGKPWQIWWITGGLPNFTIHKFNNIL